MNTFLLTILSRELPPRLLANEMCVKIGCKLAMCKASLYGIDVGFSSPGGSAGGDCESPQSFLAWPVYSNFITGDPGGKKKISVLLEAAKRGQDVRGVMRDRGYSFPFHFVNWDTAQGWVGGHNVMHVGQRHFSSHVGMRREPAYMWLSSWSTTGRRHNSRWLLNGQVK